MRRSFLLIDCLTYLRSRILAESPRRGNELRRDWQETIAQFRHEVMLMAHNSAGVHQDVARSRVVSVSNRGLLPLTDSFLMD